MSDSRIRLFVYGTLRKGNSAFHYLKNEKLLKAGMQLEGYALYKDEMYPYMVKDAQGRHVIGDLFEIDELKMNEIVFYEGPFYRKVFLEEIQAYAFLKEDEDLSGLKLVKKGEWKQ